LLEKPGLTARLANMVGKPIEQGIKLLPAGWQKIVHKATKAALEKALSHREFARPNVVVATVEGKY